MKHPLDAAIDRGDTPIELLNGLTTPGFGWVMRRAGREFIDDMGATIEFAEDHYARDLPGGGTTWRLSVGSMERLLKVVFSSNFFGADIAAAQSKATAENREAGLRAAASSLEPSSK